MLPILEAEHRWECPACGLQHVTYRRDVHTPFHQCRSLKGVLAPFVAAGTKAKLTVHERGDYVGRELVRTDGEGRPVMSITTTRDDGEDCAIYAPTARGSIDG